MRITHLGQNDAVLCRNGESPSDEDEKLFRCDMPNIRLTKCRRIQDEMGMIQEARMRRNVQETAWLDLIRPVRNEDVRLVSATQQNSKILNIMAIQKGLDLKRHRSTTHLRILISWTIILTFDETETVERIRRRSKVYVCVVQKVGAGMRPVELITEPTFIAHLLLSTNERWVRNRRRATELESTRANPMIPPPGSGADASIGSLKKRRARHLNYPRHTLTKNEQHPDGLRDATRNAGPKTAA